MIFKELIVDIASSAISTSDFYLENLEKGKYKDGKHILEIPEFCFRQTF